MKLWGWVLIGFGVAAGIGFLVGRASGGVDDRELRDSLAVYRAQRTQDRVALDSSRTRINGLAAFVATVNAEAERWRSRALASEARGNVHRGKADSLLALLAIARTPQDSNAILVNACTERGLECAAIRTANAELKEAAGKDSLAKRTLREEIGVHLDQRRRDSTSLANADGLITKLAKAARGCRLPLIGLPCPEPLGSYSLDDRVIRVGGLVPVKLGRLGRVNLSVTTTIGRRTP